MYLVVPYLASESEATDFDSVTTEIAGVQEIAEVIEFAECNFAECNVAGNATEAEQFDHGVETYISFDSPHWGAYTPPAIQEIPTFLEDAFRWRERGFSWSEAP